MQTVLSYYGGKQKIASAIIRTMQSLPFKSWYVEPFCGGAAVFFALPTNRFVDYTLNDKNNLLVNFYTQAQSNREELIKFMEGRLVYAESLHSRAKDIYKGMECDEVERAWAVWYSSISCFSSVFGGGFSYKLPSSGSYVNKPRGLQNYFKRFVENSVKLRIPTILNRDALDVCKLMDSPMTIFYLDPPYVGSNQGHYSGYTQDDFNDLLQFLSRTKAKFILSHYENEAMNGFIKDNGWCVQKIDTLLWANRSGENTTRVEWLVSNFTPNRQWLS